MNTSDESSWIDETLSDQYIGRTALVGVTYVDHQDIVTAQKQWAGTISEFPRERGIWIRVNGSGDEVTVPPDSRGIRPAPSGVYRLRSTGEVVENPDYLLTWTCVSPPPKRAKRPRGDL